MSIVRGGTRIHWMIGTPISQVQMPGLANTYFGETGCDEVLMPMEVHPEHLEAVLGLYASASNVGGLISTLPHKAALSRLVDRRSERASLIGMVNVVRKDGGRLVGDILDGEALVLALESRGFTIGGSAALVIGCGGFGSAAALGLLLAGARRVDLLDIEPQRSAALVQRLQEHVEGHRVRSLAAGPPFEAELLVQASSQGMRVQDEPPVDLHQVRGLQVVVDAVAGVETRLLRAARAAGLAVVSGEEIALAQLQPVLRFWASADTDSVHEDTQSRPRISLSSSGGLARSDRSGGALETVEQHNIRHPCMETP